MVSLFFIPPDFEVCTGCDDSMSVSSASSFIYTDNASDVTEMVEIMSLSEKYCKQKLLPPPTVNSTHPSHFTAQPCTDCYLCVLYTVITVILI